MSKFLWCIDTDNYVPNISSKPVEDKMSTRSFINGVCKQLNHYSETYTIAQLKSGNVPHCHSHSIEKIPTKKSKEYVRLFNKLVDINTKLGRAPNPTQLSEEDILQLSLDNITQRFRCFGYVLDNVFYLIHLDPYHKVYSK